MKSIDLARSFVGQRLIKVEEIFFGDEESKNDEPMSLCLTFEGGVTFIVNVSDVVGGGHLIMKSTSLKKEDE